MKPELPSSENRMHYPALDGLQAIALVLVILQHYVDMFWGYAGVDLFFVLPGFFDYRDLFLADDGPAGNPVDLASGAFSEGRNCGFVARRSPVSGAWLLKKLENLGAAGNPSGYRWS